MIRLLVWIIMIPVAAVLVAFAVSNRQTTVLDLWPLPFQLDTPVYLAVLLAALAGFLLGGLISWLSALRRTHRKVARVKARASEEKDALRSRLEQDAPATEPSRPAPPAVVDGSSPSHPGAQP